MCSNILGIFSLSAIKSIIRSETFFICVFIEHTHADSSLCFLCEVCVFSRFAKREPRSLKWTLTQHSCHEFGIFDFQQLAPNARPLPVGQGRGREVEWGGVRGRKEGPSWKTHSQLWLFTSLWHVCGCFHGDGSKDSWDVSEMGRWLLDASWRMKQETQEVGDEDASSTLTQPVGEMPRFLLYSCT